VDEPAFDTGTNILTFSNKDGYVATYAYQYKLVNNIFKLLKETKTEFTNCDENTGQCKESKETVMYKAADNG
jgi:hypothetical protein